MLLKFRFKNYACFKEWQELDLLDFSNSLNKTNASIVSSILGENSSGKTSVIKLLKISIEYLKHFLNYEKSVNLNINKNRTILSKANPFVFNDFSNELKKSNILEIKKETENDDSEISDELISLESENNQNTKNENKYEFYNTSIELYFVNEDFIFKYELKFNHLYSEYEKLSFQKNDDIENKEWKYLFKKENLTFEAISNEEICLYNIDLDLKELQIAKEPSFIHINKKNSLISYIKSIADSKLLNDFVQMYSNTLFIDENNWQGLYKFYVYDTDFFIKNKARFIIVLNELGYNIVDFSINKVNVNTFCLMIGKKNIDGSIMYINSENESDTFNKLICIFYYVFNAIDNGYSLIIDSIDRFFNNNIVSYIIDLFNKQSEKNKTIQLIFTIDALFENDLVGICQSTSKLEFNNLESKLKRIV